jgi:hypothetical protein
VSEPTAVDELRAFVQRACERCRREAVTSEERIAYQAGLARLLKEVQTAGVRSGVRREEVEPALWEVEGCLLKLLRAAPLAGPRTPEAGRLHHALGRRLDRVLFFGLEPARQAILRHQPARGKPPAAPEWT